MRINPANALIAVLISALIAYGIVSADANTIKAASGFGSFVSLACTLVMAIGISFENGRTGANMRTLAFMFFIGALGLNCLYVFAGFSQTSYVITCSSYFLLYVFAANALFAARH
jgi:hypothetical protein